MNLRRTFLWSLGVGLLAGLAMGTASAAADPVEITGTIVVYQGEDGDFDVYIRRENGGEYLVSGRKVAELRNHAGKAVTATGSIAEDVFGVLQVAVHEFAVAED
jgi:hypothetical protein